MNNLRTCCQQQLTSSVFASLLQCSPLFCYRQTSHVAPFSPVLCDVCHKRAPTASTAPLPYYWHNAIMVCCVFLTNRLRGMPVGSENSEKSPLLAWGDLGKPTSCLACRQELKEQHTREAVWPLWNSFAVFWKIHLHLYISFSIGLVLYSQVYLTTFPDYR